MSDNLEGLLKFSPNSFNQNYTPKCRTSLRINALNFKTSTPFVVASTRTSTHRTVIISSAPHRNQPYGIGAAPYCGRRQAAQQSAASEKNNGKSAEYRSQFASRILNTYLYECGMLENKTRRKNTQKFSVERATSPRHPTTVTFFQFYRRNKVLINDMVLPPPPPPITAITKPRISFGRGALRGKKMASVPLREHILYIVT